MACSTVLQVTLAVTIVLALLAAAQAKYTDSLEDRSAVEGLRLASEMDALQNLVRTRAWSRNSEEVSVGHVFCTVDIPVC